MKKWLLIALLLLPLTAHAFREDRAELSDLTGEDTPGAVPIPATPGGGTPWAVFEETTIDYSDKTGMLSAGWSKKVKALEGKTVKVIGFMVPTTGGKLHREFILSKLPPSCPFCPAADPNQMMLVSLKKPIAYTENPLIVQGIFKRVTDNDSIQSGLFYKMQNAEVAK